MNEKKKWLDGELKYVEGKSTVGSLLKGIATELLEQGWVDYPRNIATDYWGFNGLRQITLHSETVKRNIRLYEVVKSVLPNGDETFTKGELINEDSYRVIGKVLEGIDGTDADKTKQGKFIFIESIHSDVQFQQTTFVKKSGVNGLESIEAKLKSIPKGELTLYKDTLIRVDNEVLLNKNSNGLIYNLARAPISQSKDATKKLIVKVAGSIVDEKDYTVDYFNGNVIFDSYTTGEVQASYSTCTGERGDEIDVDSYNVMGKTIFTVDDLLINTDIIVDINYYWNLHYPESINQISDRVIFKTKVDVSPDKSQNAFKTFYWEIGKHSVDLPTTKITKEKMQTHDKVSFYTKYQNLKMKSEDGDVLYTVYVDDVEQIDTAYTINRNGIVIFPDEQGGEVTLDLGLIEAEDYQYYSLGHKNIIEGTLRLVANKGSLTSEYEIPLSRADINYATGEVTFKEAVTGSGRNQTASKTTDFTYLIATNDALFKVENVVVNGNVVSPSTYTVDLIGKTIKLNNPIAYGNISPTSVTCDFETETTVHAEYKWSNLVEISYEYYPPEDSPAFDNLIKGNQAMSDYVTGFRSRFSSKLESSLPSSDYNSGHYRLSEHHVSAWSKWSWYRRKPVFDGDVKIGTWTPVKFYMNFTREYVNIVLQGDHSIDVHPYKNYIISYAYVGALENYQCSADDAINNFAMTVGSDVLYNKEFYDNKETELLPELWGYKTGTGVTDIVMERTHSNLPFQAHYPAFYTNPEFLDKHFITVSETTKKHHFSPITIVHGTERERGKMQSVVIGDRSAIFHLDELIEHRDEFNTENAQVTCKGDFLNECGLPITSKEKKYIQFNINAPYWFANNSPNTLYGIAIRKS